MRVNFELPEPRIAELKALQAETEAESMKELLNTALTVLEWAVSEIKDGNEIAAVNEDQNVYRVLITPLLQRVKKRQLASA